MIKVEVKFSRCSDLFDIKYDGDFIYGGSGSSPVTTVLKMLIGKYKLYNRPSYILLNLGREIRIGEIKPKIYSSECERCLFREYIDGTHCYGYGCCCYKDKNNDYYTVYRIKRSSLTTLFKVSQLRSILCHRKNLICMEVEINEA